MTDSTSAPHQRDYRDTVFLPKTDFPMKAGLPQKEPLILAKWLESNLEAQIREARKGRDVVRLKGGDPFVFGRGGEEMEAAQAAGVRVEIVPGVSAANGAAAAAGIALTHRDASSIVSFVAGQCKGLAEQDWAGLAGKGRTLVIYMGIKTAPQIAEKLMADGLSPHMPVAVIENGARPDMRVLRGPLAGLPDMVERERVVSPALIVIGEVTARDDINVAACVEEFVR